MEPGLSLHRLTANHIEQGVALSRLAGWNQTPERWKRMLTVATPHCFGISVDGQLAATTVLVQYGTECAWLAMVLTHPEHRRRGYARTLVEHGLQEGKKAGVRTIKLDASDAGRSLYERLGFKSEGRVERWMRAGAAPAEHPSREYSLSVDREAYGYDRSRVLQAVGALLTEEAREASVLTRAGLEHGCIGPCISRSAVAAEEVLRPVLAVAQGWSWDLLPSNTEATQLAASFGFSPVREWVRMRLGPELPERTDLIFAIAGLEFG